MKYLPIVLVALALSGCNNSDTGGAGSVANIATQTGSSGVTAPQPGQPLTVIQSSSPATEPQITVQDVLSEIHFEVYRVYSQSPYDNNTDVVEWAPCKTDAVIINGGCDCGNSVTMMSYQQYNAQFCKCGSWTYRMLAYAVCLKGPGLSSPNYQTEQTAEADRLNEGGVTGTGSTNTMHTGALQFNPSNYTFQ